jgi:hypothetical protein
VRNRPGSPGRHAAVVVLLPGSPCKASTVASWGLTVLHHRAPIRRRHPRGCLRISNVSKGEPLSRGLRSPDLRTVSLMALALTMPSEYRWPVTTQKEDRHEGL